MCLRAITAPIGTVPEVRPLAVVTRSGMHAEILGRRAGAEAAEGGDHLVEDQQDAVLLGDRAQALQVARRRRVDADRAGHRLDDHRGDGRRVVQRHQPLQRVGELGAVLGLRRG